VAGDWLEINKSLFPDFLYMARRLMVAPAWKQTSVLVMEQTEKWTKIDTKSIVKLAGPS